VRIFADTFYWVALLNRKDGANRAVLDFSRTLGSSTLITTDEVPIELLAFCASDQQLRMAAALTMQDILDGGNVRAIPQSRAGLLGGLALYKARPDKGYSLTDCISMQAMRREGLTDVLTNDRHFEQEGFRALFRST
jgi:predicted nucleic acid-binding protein